jgi:hypothetical protein
MKTYITLMCAIAFSMAAIETGYGNPDSSVCPAGREERMAPKSDVIILASNVEFQRTVQTQTTLIHDEASERRRKIAQQHADADAKYLEAKKEMQKRAR